MALDLITSKEVCVMINQSFRAYIDEMQRVEIHLQAMWERTRVLHQVSLDDTSLGFTGLLEKLTDWFPNFA